MERRPLGRERGLEVRMVVALTLLVLSYAIVIALFVALCAFLIASWPLYGWIAVLPVAAIVVAVARRYRGAGEALIGALVVDADDNDDPALRSRLERLAALGQLPTPRLVVAESDAGNAFAVGIHQRKTTIVVTRGLLSQLEPEEVEAVLAHELAHVANRDAAVMTIVSTPRLLGEVMIGQSTSVLGALWFVVWPLGFIPLALGTLFTLIISRYREFNADRGAVLLTGSAAALMSAIRKLSAGAAAIPHEDLRAASAFCVVSTETHRWSLFSDHPPVEKRLAALEEMARELGKPARPSGSHAKPGWADAQPRPKAFARADVRAPHGSQPDTAVHDPVRARDRASTAEPSIAVDPRAVGSEKVSIWVDAEAAERIRSKGGRLFLWQKPAGGLWLMDKAGFTLPMGQEGPFARFEVDGVEVLVAHDVELPDRIEISHAHLPPLKLHIDWDGEPWGHRGRAEGPRE